MNFSESISLLPIKFEVLKLYIAQETYSVNEGLFLGVFFLCFLIMSWFMLMWCNLSTFSKLCYLSTKTDNSSLIMYNNTLLLDIYKRGSWNCWKPLWYTPQPAFLYLCQTLYWFFLFEVCKVLLGIVKAPASQLFLWWGSSASCMGHLPNALYCMS